MSPLVLADWAHPETAVIDDEPNWLTNDRQQSAAYVAARGFPTRKDEDWRYVKLDNLYALPLVPALPAPFTNDEAAAAIAALMGKLPDLGGARFVFVDGQFAPGHSRQVHTTGAEIIDLQSGVQRGLLTEESYAGGAPAAGQAAHAFAALNKALATTGVVVKVPANQAVAAPVHIVQISTSAEPTLANLANFIDVADGGAVTVVVSSLGTQDATGCTNTRTTVSLGSAARLDFYEIQDQPVGVYHLSHLDVTQSERSVLAGHVDVLGGDVARHEIHVRQVGEAAETELDGLYVPRGTQQHDNPVLIEHFARNGVSRQTYRGVVDDLAHGVFNGRIVVHEGAVGIVADQSNKNLLLSDRAEVDTRPRLEIYADDVECTHGATVGQLNEDAMFYLRTRGIPEEEARRVLTYAFIEEIVERVPDPTLRSRIESLVSARLHPDSDVRDGKTVSGADN